jgi:hypothetical protein
MNLTLLLLLALGADEWSEVDEDDGIKLEARDVKNTSHRELRVTTTTKHSPEALCAAAFGDGSFDSKEPTLKARKLLAKGDNELVIYDQLATPVVSDRDVVLKVRREQGSDGSCRVFIDAISRDDIPAAKGFVRIDWLKGSWLFAPKGNGETAVTYTIFTDPKSSMPRMMIEPPRRKIAFGWVKLVLERAAKKP